MNNTRAMSLLLGSLIAAGCWGRDAPTTEESRSAHYTLPAYAESMLLSERAVVRGVVLDLHTEEPNTGRLPGTYLTVRVDAVLLSRDLSDGAIAVGDTLRVRAPAVSRACGGEDEPTIDDVVVAFVGQRIAGNLPVEDTRHGALGNNFICKRAGVFKFDQSHPGYSDVVVESAALDEGKERAFAALAQDFSAQPRESLAASVRAQCANLRCATSCFLGVECATVVVSDRAPSDQMLLTGESP